MIPAIFLDRDGTINKDKKYLYRIEDSEYMDGVINALSELSKMGFKLIIITNQSGIARGYYTEDDYQTFMDWMVEDLIDKGVYITAHYWCPHLLGAKVKKYDVKCDCRKPAIGLFYQAAEEHNIDMNHSFAVGDRLRDLSVCRETNVNGILLGDREMEAKADFPYQRCHSWNEAVDYIKREKWRIK